LSRLCPPNPQNQLKRKGHCTGAWAKRLFKRHFSFSKAWGKKEGRKNLFLVLFLGGRKKKSAEKIALRQPNCSTAYRLPIETFLNQNNVYILDLPNN
jgi:hypothetical protein